MGAGVEGFAVGDAVFGIAPGGLGGAVLGAAALLAPLPPGVSFAEAATVPTTYAAVLAALDKSTQARTAALRPGAALQRASMQRRAQQEGVSTVLRQV